MATRRLFAFVVVLVADPVLLSLVLFHYFLLLAAALLGCKRPSAILFGQLTLPVCKAELSRLRFHLTSFLLAPCLISSLTTPTVK